MSVLWPDKSDPRGLDQAISRHVPPVQDEDPPACLEANACNGGLKVFTSSFPDELVPYLRTVRGALQSYNPSPPLAFLSTGS